MAGRVMVGKVVSAKMQKSVVVEVERMKDLGVGKLFARHSRHIAHDEESVCKEGDIVEIVLTRPLSRHKNHYVSKILPKMQLTEQGMVVVSSERTVKGPKHVSAKGSTI